MLTFACPHCHEKLSVPAAIRRHRVPMPAVRRAGAGPTIRKRHLAACASEGRRAKDAAVIGEPDEEHGEIVTAVVVANNGKLDLASLERHCAEHLGKSKRPRRIDVVKELPKNFLGKIQRRKVREGRKETNEQAEPVAE